jgi:hypothetical protein
MKLEWTELFDDLDNSYYEAPSPYYVDDAPIMWRLRQGLVGNKHNWHEAHDEELMDLIPEAWRTLKAAQRAIQKAHDGLLLEIANG